MEINKMHIFLRDLQSLKKLLLTENKLDFSEIKARGWKSLQLDDKNIFGTDAINLENALKNVGIDEFFVVRSFDIFCSENKIACLKVPSIASAIELFQKNDFDLEIPILDCLIFDKNLKFLIFRPGTFEHSMVYSGSEEFLKVATCSEGWTVPSDF